ncbi:MAG: hypothetical protein A2283_07150 [Lentisphaerae bacterium RIFOXYA12_FULL_48_11]|nr:MAG: hypothetical protein A2283_07150 [Lentisphaerae bacterium RIFOXYA12_FULL_48_11]
MAADNPVAPVEILPDNLTNKVSTVGLAAPAVSPAEQPAVVVPVTNLVTKNEIKIEPLSPQKVPADIQSKTNVQPREVTISRIPSAAALTDAVRKKEDDGQAQVMSDELAAARAKLQEFSVNRSVGRLKDLERKAMAYDSLSTKLELKDQLIEKLKMELREAQSTITNQQAQIDCLVSTTNDLNVCIKNLTEEKAPLKEALDILRLGKYEYYQIEEKDTCESISAKPSIYGDATKHTLIRQANKGNVANLDKLVPGEVLIIPRITVSERHDF